MRVLVQLSTCFLVCSLSVTALGQELGTGNSGFSVGAALLSFNALKNTTSETSETSTLGTNYAAIQLQAKASLLGITLGPRLLYTPLAVKAPDDGSSSRVLYISVPAVFSFGANWNVRGGLGYLIRTIKGEGGTTVLGNGQSTSTFILPDESRSSKNFTLETGIFRKGAGKYEFGLELIGTSVLTERRSLNLLLAVNYEI